MEEVVELTHIKLKGGDQKFCSRFLPGKRQVFLLLLSWGEILGCFEVPRDNHGFKTL